MLRLVIALGAVVALEGGCKGSPGTVTEELGVDLGTVDQSLPDITLSDAVVPDTGSPLGVVTTSPLDGALAVTCDTAVTAIFTEAVDATTVTAKTFTVSGAKGAVSGKVTAAQKVVTFQPDVRFAPLVPHTVVLGTGIKTPDGRSMPKAKTWTFTCDLTWGKHMTVATGSATHYNTPLAAIDGNGDAHVFWGPRKHGYLDQIWYSAYDSSSQKWSAPVLFKNKAGNYRVMRDFSGDVWVTWLERPKITSTTVFARRYDHKSRSWQAAASTSVPLPTSGHVAAAAHDGGVTVALHSNTSVYVTYSAHVLSYSRTAGTWSKPDKVVTARGLGYLVLATDRTGSKVFFGWYLYNDLNLSTRGLWVASQGVASSGWTTGEHLVPGLYSLPGPFMEKLLVVDSRGNATVIIPNWDKAKNAHMGFLARSFDPASGKWGAATAITSRDIKVCWSVSDIDQDTGRIVVAYFECNSKGYTDTAAVRYDPIKKSWSTLGLVTKTRLVSLEDVAVDRHGNGVLLYRPNNNVLSAYRLNGTTGLWGPTVNLFFGSIAIPPKVALGGQGEALVVWNSGFKAIYARWFR